LNRDQYRVFKATVLKRFRHKLGEPEIDNSSDSRHYQFANSKIKIQVTTRPTRMKIDLRRLDGHSMIIKEYYDFIEASEERARRLEEYEARGLKILS